MVYILSGIIYKFFSFRRLGAVHEHLHLAFFGSDHNRLLAHTADHIKRISGFSPQGKLQGVFLHTLLQRLFQGMGDFEEPVGRTQAADALMGPLVVVIFHPEVDPSGSILVAGELGPLQKLPEDRLPEPLDLAQRHGVVRAGFDVLDAVFLKLPLKARSAPPVGVLAPVVGEHLLGNAVFGHGTPVGLKNVFGGLAAVKTHTGNVAGIIVHKADQIGIATGQPEGHDVALPHLIGRGPFKKPRCGRVLLDLGFWTYGEPFFSQSTLHAAGAGGN